MDKRFYTCKIGHPGDEGIGECCEFMQSCNVEKNQVHVEQLVTVLDSMGPMFHDLPCSFIFAKEPKICQIRLDFLHFTSTKANEDGICEVDKLRIINSVTVDRDFTTCGDLTGQHMYLTFGSQDSIEISLLMKSHTHHYRIIATKIPCNSRHRVPDYCLQHFTQPYGMVRSFDYGGQQQSNQMYTVCVKPTTQSSEIMWKSCTPGSAGNNSFDIISNSSPPPLQGDTCTTDWVQVRGLKKSCEVFPAQKSSWKPYEILVNFDEIEVPPPPPSFTVPIDPANCMATCTSYSVTNLYDCGCVGTAPKQWCQCTVLAPGFGGPPMTPLTPEIDINNTGFCLEYTQV